MSQIREINPVSRCTKKVRGGRKRKKCLVKESRTGRVWIPLSDNPNPVCSLAKKKKKKITPCGKKKKWTTHSSSCRTKLSSN